MIEHIYLNELIDEDLHIRHKKTKTPEEIKADFDREFVEHHEKQVRQLVADAWCAIYEKDGWFVSMITPTFRSKNFREVFDFNKDELGVS